jgi:hypothetical protein
MAANPLGAHQAGSNFRRPRCRKSGGGNRRRAEEARARHAYFTTSGPVLFIRANPRNIAGIGLNPTRLPASVQLAQKMGAYIYHARRVGSASLGGKHEIAVAH